VVLMGDLLPAEAAHANEQKQVLVLHATRRDAQIAVLADRQLKRILERGLGNTVDFYDEYLDFGRFPEEDYQRVILDFLRQKYRNQSFDLIISMHDRVLQFVEAYRGELFPGTPVVFLSTDPAVRRIPNSTGMVAPIDYASTLALVARLQPEVRRVAVVSDASGDAAREQFAAFAARYQFTYLTGLPTADLEQRLAELPPDTIAYYLSVDRDGAGETFRPLEYLDRVVGAASVPVYCWVDSAMGRGIVGGSLKSQVHQLEALGRLALRVLRGEEADGIPLVSPDLQVVQVDWRQLRRWGIRESRLPLGTLVLFKDPSAWDRYKGYIAGAIVLMLAQSALIGALLVQRTRRRRAEEQVQGSQAELKQSYDRLRDLAGRLVHAQDEEGARIARELHDDVSQQLALLCSDLELLSGLADQESVDTADEALRRVESITRSVRELSHRLHPARLQLIGLVGSLQALQREVSKTGLRVTFLHENVPARLPADLTHALFRVVQEALKNAARHGRARHVGVHLKGNSRELTLTATDDGVGFDTREAFHGGLGLVSMRERLEAVAGTIDVHSRPGAGTEIHVRVPLRPASEEAEVP
jgi:signal transduction histidine kinase